MLKNKKHYSYDLLFISILTLITVVIWIGLAVYQSLTTSTILKILEDQLRPIKPGFDTQVIDALNLRKRITQQELDQLPPRMLKFAKEVVEKVEESTASAQGEVF